MGQVLFTISFVVVKQAIAFQYIRAAWHAMTNKWDRSSVACRGIGLSDFMQRSFVCVPPQSFSVAGGSHHGNPSGCVHPML